MFKSRAQSGDWWIWWENQGVGEYSFLKGELNNRQGNTICLARKIKRLPHSIKTFTLNKHWLS